MEIHEGTWKGLHVLKFLLSGTQGLYRYHRGKTQDTPQSLQVGAQLETGPDPKGDVSLGKDLGPFVEINGQKPVD